MSSEGDIVRSRAVILLIALLLSAPSFISLTGAETSSGTVDQENAGGATEAPENDAVWNDQMDGKELYAAEEPTRSIPWNQWQRFHYHGGGAWGLAASHEEENRIFVYGGGSDSWRNQPPPGSWSHSSSNDFFYFDLNNNGWVNVPDVPNPSARHGFSYAVDEGRDKFYIYGGYAGSMVDDFWSFDMTTLTWKNLDGSLLEGPVGNRRAYAPMVIDTTDGTTGKVYIHMGMDDDDGNFDRDNKTGFYKVDLASPTSSPTILNDGVTNGVVPRYYHTMCIDEDSKEIYMFGGYNTILGNLKEFWVYSIPSDTWTPLSVPVDMPILVGARIFFRPSDGTVNIWGGRINTTLLENKLLWTYDTELGTWWNTTLGLVDEEGRLDYDSHYSRDLDRFVVFAGAYYYQGYFGATRGTYRDMNYLSMGTKTWTSFPNNSSSSTNMNGIFAFDQSTGMANYVGPNAVQNNGTVYTYRYNTATKAWRGPYYNTGTSNPRTRSSAGMCYDVKNNTVYMYGGGYTTGQQPNVQYHDLSDFWKLDLDTQLWTQIFPAAGTGERQGFEMLFNPNDGLIYFFGGHQHPTTSSESYAYEDFYKYNPVLQSFQEIPMTGTHPQARYGAGLVMVPDMNKMYLLGGEDPNPTDSVQYRDLWSYDFSANIWTELRSLTSYRIFPKMDYDPLLKEILVTGGQDSVINRYRILEDTWTLLDPDVDPGSMEGNAHFFDQTNRDLWVFGGGATSGIWKIGLLARLAIQNIDFTNPENGVDLAYSMLKPYNFNVQVKTIYSPDDLSEVSMSFLHRSATYTIVYNYTEDKLESGGVPWSEKGDAGDYAEIWGTPKATWNGPVIELDVSILFHWNFSSRGSISDRTIVVNARGVDIMQDILDVKGFLNVKNQLELVGDLQVTSSVQGDLEEGEWVRSGELVTFAGPLARYVGTTNVYPAEGTYGFSIWEENDRQFPIGTTPGTPMNFSLNAPDVSKSDLKYTVNLSDVNEDSELSIKTFNISVDGIAPSAPGRLVVHADSFTDTKTAFDNDQLVYPTWDASDEDLSGILTYYWSFEDRGGTQNGQKVGETQAEVVLPSNGTHKIFIWAEDQVGNIGSSSNASITIDTESITFRIVKPDISGFIPYQVLDITVNITDTGGSKLNIQSIQYRFTNEGQNSDVYWLGSNAWNYMPDIWTSFPKHTIEFDMTLGKGKIPQLSDSEENFLQFKASDGAGTETLSEIYNIKVDTDLRFPKVTLLSPSDGAVFNSSEEVMLNWTVDFFLPEDVKYHLYISDNKREVEEQMEGVMTPLSTMQYSPIWAVYGTYYWTVIPIAQDRWVGNATNGIFSFTVKNDANFAIEVTTDTSITHKYAKGGFGIPIEFRVKNLGQERATVFVGASLSGVAKVDWKELANGFNLTVGNSLQVVAYIDIMSDAPVDTYNFTFFFNTSRGVKKTITLSVSVVETIGVDDDGNEPNPTGMIVAIGILVLLLLMLALAAIYFLVIKKKGKKTLSEQQMDRLDGDILLSKDRAFAMAPTPQGLRPMPVKGRLPPKKAEGADEEVQELEEFPDGEVKLVEEGSEDDWMNLVASETKSLEAETGTVKDKAVKPAADKTSVTDILSQMSDGVEDQK